MKPTAPAGPHPDCILCSDERACAFHAARSHAELGRAFYHTLRTRGSLALVDLLTWALTHIEQMIPGPVLTGISGLDDSVIRDEFTELLDQDEYDTETLRRLAAVALAAALITEAQQDENDHGPSAPPKPQQRQPKSPV